MPKPYSQFQDHEARPVVSYDGLQDVAETHKVDAKELNLQANLYQYNLEILNVSIPDKHKRYTLILRYIEQDKLQQARNAYDASDLLPEAHDLSLDYMRQRVQENLDVLPVARKGQNKTHRHTFVLNLAELYPENISRSHSDSKPSSPFFKFCRDTFDAIGDKTGDHAINESIRIILNK